MALERALRELLNVRPKSPYYSHLDQFVTTSGENDTVQRSVVLECTYDKPNLSQGGKGQFLGRPANLGRAPPHWMGNRVPRASCPGQK